MLHVVSAADDLVLFVWRERVRLVWHIGKVIDLQSITVPTVARNLLAGELQHGARTCFWILVRLNEQNRESGETLCVLHDNEGTVQCGKKSANKET
jgi:hypothetical protein